MDNKGVIIGLLHNHHNDVLSTSSLKLPVRDTLRFQSLICFAKPTPKFHLDFKVRIKSSIIDLLRIRIIKNS